MNEGVPNSYFSKASTSFFQTFSYDVIIDVIVTKITICQPQPVHVRNAICWYLAIIEITIIQINVCTLRNTALSHVGHAAR